MLLSIYDQHLDVDPKSNKFVKWTGWVVTGGKIGETKKFTISFDNQTLGPIVPILSTKAAGFFKILDFQIKTIFESLLEDAIHNAKKYGYEGPLQEKQNRQISIFVRTNK